MAVDRRHLPEKLSRFEIREAEALLSREATFSFPAAFQLLPPEGDFNNADRWLEGGWGVFADPAVRKDPAYRAQLERMLAAHRESWSALESFQGKPDALAVVGTGRPTVAAVHPADLDHPDRADGDGSVPLASATLAGARLFTTRAEHAGLLLDAGVQAAIAKFLGARQ